MVSVPCYRCTRYHRIIPLVNMLSHHKGIVLKSSRPSLPLKKAPPFSPSLSSIVFTPPSVPPVLGDRNPQGREDVTALQCYICPTCPSPAGGSLTHSQALALSKRARDVTAPSRCSEPLRSKDGGASKPLPNCAGWDRLDAIGDIASDASVSSAFTTDSSASTALDVVQRELKHLGLWKFAG